MVFTNLVLPPQPGLLVHGCYWPQPSATPDVLSVSDRVTEEEEHGVQAGQPLSSPAATDATMADEEASEAVSVHSSSSESPTMPSAVQPAEDDAHMEDGDSATTSSADESDCLSNHPASPETRPAQDFFFHEYGRRVGMVPRSSLKEGKKGQMVEKGTKTPKNRPKTKHPSPQADSTIL